MNDISSKSYATASKKSHRITFLWTNKENIIILSIYSRIQIFFNVVQPPQNNPATVSLH